MSDNSCSRCGAELEFEDEIALCAFRYQRCELRIFDLGTITITPPSREVAVLMGRLMRLAHEPVNGSAGEAHRDEQGCSHTGVWSWEWFLEGDEFGPRKWSDQALSSIELLRRGV